MRETAHLVVNEHLRADGTLEQTTLAVREDGLWLLQGETALRLPEAALRVVWRRYGKPLALGDDEGRDGEEGAVTTMETLRTRGLLRGEPLAVGAGQWLVRFRYLPRFAVIGHDYLALFSDGDEPLCEQCVTICEPLLYLARSSK
jgi:hypothetical protein